MWRRLATAGLVVSLGLLTSCGGADDSAGDTGDGGTTAIKVGVIPIVDVAPIYLGVQEGFFKDRGLDVSLEAGQGGAAILPGVVSDQFQFGFSNVTSLLLAQSKGLPIQIVANGNNSTGVDGKDFGAVVVPAGSDITDAAGLAGKKVAVNTLNNIGTTTVNASIEKAGGDPSGVQYVELGFPDMPAALAAGQVDAAWVVEPFLTITKSDGAVPVASNFVDTAPNLMVADYFTTAQYAGKNPDVVKAFTDAMNESLEYAQENPDAVREVLSSYTEISADLLPDLTLPAWPTEIDTSSLDVLNELAAKDGLIEKPADVDALLP